MKISDDIAEGTLNLCIWKLFVFSLKRYGINYRTV